MSILTKATTFDIEKEAVAITLSIFDQTDKRCKEISKLDSSTGQRLLFLILTKLIATMTYAVLHKAVKLADGSSMTGKARTRYADKAYVVLRGCIEEAVATGFMHGMQLFSGQLIDYYVQLRAVPEPKSKVAN